MPHKTNFSKNGNIYTWFGEKNKSIYQADYIDSIVLIPNSNAFKLSLEGFVSGLVVRQPFPKYDIIVNDTLIGKTTGVFVKFGAGDRGLKYKTVFYYITMADHKYHWFSIFNEGDPNEADNEYFWNSIRFNSDGIRERDFTLDKIHLKKLEKIF